MSMVDAVVTSLVTNVSHLLAQETNLVLNARNQVESLQSELKFIKSFLRHHSEGKRDEVREEVKQIHDVSVEAEAVLDDFVIKMAKYNRWNRLQRFFFVGKKIILLRKVALKIQRINKKLKKIHQNKDKYTITTNNDGAGAVSEISVQIQSRRNNVEEDEVVSFDNDAKLVIGKLDTKDSQRDVVSIVGMGGLGKTTLAKKIYNSSFVKQSFDFRAWADVSQDYKRKDLLLKIAKSLQIVRADTLTDYELVEKLRTGLEGSKYMIVLDDVWDKHLWDGIKAAFPNNRKGSRVLITSRLKEVASHASVHTPPYFLPLLEEDDSWKLFSKKVFHDQVFPPQLEQLARQQILPKCKGLPLAIVVVAGLLRTREQSLWANVASGLNWYLAQDPTGCHAILALSYDDLPPHLKSCFLYFGIYPEDFDIRVRKLIRLWVAEGFIDEETNNNLDMEDIAEEYLLQLIDRSLIQVASRKTDGRVKSCRIHDLLRDMSIDKGKKEKFLVVDTKVDGSSLASNKPIRRLSVHNGSRDIRYDYFSVSEFSHLLSLFSFGHNKGKPDVAIEEDAFSNVSEFCPNLRVLDLGSARYVNMPPNVEKLVQLRYLETTTPTVYEILPSISKLVNLQTLDLRGSYRITFSANLLDMQQLRHLYLSSEEPTVIKLNIQKANGNSALPNLRSLKTLQVTEADDLNILKALPNLKSLRAYCKSFGKEEVKMFEYISKLERLQKLHIIAKFQFTDPGTLPSSLTKISLILTCMDTSAFAKLGWLPNLQVLKLRYESLTGSILEYDSNQGKFPRLEVLHLHELDIESWSMEGKGLQSLVYLDIWRCRKLKSIPDQLKQLRTLRQLKVTGDCHGDFKESLKQIWGVNDPRLHF